MEGWLWKKGHRIKNWKRRWFVLDRHHGFVLSYYEKDNKKTLKGTYILSASAYITKVAAEGTRQFLFVLHASGSNGEGELVMAAASPTDLTNWTSGINNMIDMCNSKGSGDHPPPSPLVLPDLPMSIMPSPPSSPGYTTEDVISFPKLGLKVKGLAQFISLCGGEEELNGLTTSQVCEKYLKDVTRDVKMSYCNKLLSEGHDSVGNATHFISHAWQHKFLDTCSAIADCFEHNRGAIVWFDLFSNNQHLTPVLDFDWLSTTYKTAIQQLGHTVVVFSPWDNPIPLTRAWCLYELYCTAASNCSLEVAMAKGDVHIFLETVTRDTEQYFKMLSQIDVRKAVSYNAHDKELIFDVIEKNIGFDNINLMISTKLQKWVIMSLEKSLNNSVPEVAIKRKIALAEILRVQGSFVKALDQYREILRENEELASEDFNWISATCYNGIGQVYDSRGKYEESLAYYEKSLQCRLSSRGGMHVDVGELYKNMAVAYTHQHNYDVALEYYQQALSAFVPRLGDSHPTIGGIYNSIAVVFSNLNNSTKALLYFKKSLRIDIAKLGANHPNVGGTFSNMAGLEDTLGNYKQALEYYHSALKIFLLTLGENHPGVGGLYFNMAVVYMSMGDIDMVLDCYNKTLKIFIVCYGDTHISVGDIYVNIANMHANQSCYAEALKDLEKALGIFLGSPGDHPQNIGDIYYDMAMVYYLQEMYQESLLYYDKSLEIRIPMLGMNHPAIATTFKFQGVVNQYLSNLEEAMQYYSKALLILESCREADQVEIYELHGRISSVHEEQGNFKKAYDHKALSTAPDG